MAQINGIEKYIYCKKVQFRGEEITIFPIKLAQIPEVARKAKLFQNLGITNILENLNEISSLLSFVTSIKQSSFDDCEVNELLDVLNAFFEVNIDYFHPADRGEEDNRGEEDRGEEDNRWDNIIARLIKTGLNLEEVLNLTFYQATGLMQGLIANEREALIQQATAIKIAVYGDDKAWKVFTASPNSEKDLGLGDLTDEELEQWK